jgi:hypothetical protein
MLNGARVFFVRQLDDPLSETIDKKRRWLSITSTGCIFNRQKFFPIRASDQYV